LVSALSDIKVIDLTSQGPSSFAAQILGDMGAHVLKINPVPGGMKKGVGKGVDFIEGMDASAYFDTMPEMLGFHDHSAVQHIGVGEGLLQVKHFAHRNISPGQHLKPLVPCPGSEYLL